MRSQTTSFCLVSQHCRKSQWKGTFIWEQTCPTKTPNTLEIIHNSSHKRGNIILVWSRVSRIAHKTAIGTGMENIFLHVKPDLKVIRLARINSHFSLSVGISSRKRYSQFQYSEMKQNTSAIRKDNYIKRTSFYT